MKINKIEFLAMNNSLRSIIQEKYELKILRNISNIKNINSALEIGCGNGYGSKLIKKYFSPKNIFAIDIDEKMIEIAQKNNNDISVTYKVMDASRLDFSNNYFDAIFDFGIIHHIPNWKDCINELKRVLKKDGEIILEDLSKDTFQTFSGKIIRLLTTHPYAYMYSTQEFIEYLREIGFEIINFKESNPMYLIKFFSLTAKLK